MNSENSVFVFFKRIRVYNAIYCTLNTNATKDKITNCDNFLCAFFQVQLLKLQITSSLVVLEN